MVGSQLNQSSRSPDLVLKTMIMIDSHKSFLFYFLSLSLSLLCFMWNHGQNVFYSTQPHIAWITDRSSSTTHGTSSFWTCCLHSLCSLSLSFFLSNYWDPTQVHLHAHEKFPLTVTEPDKLVSTRVFLLVYSSLVDRDVTRSVLNEIIVPLNILKKKPWFHWYY